jgi:chorismate mutase/prephenate dehydratase
VFFMDCEGHQADGPVRNVLAALAERCLFLKVLGSYPAAV